MCANKQPNILLIVADDLGFSDLGSFGGEINTPALDKLAAAGVKFNQFYAAPACSPTRSMLLSGTDNHIAGVGSMYERIQRTPVYREKPGHEGYLNDKIAALPEVLNDAGYTTLMAGKWHLGLFPHLLPAKRGFDKSFSLLPACANHYGWEPQIHNEDEQDIPPLFKSCAPALHVENTVYQKTLPEDFYSSDFYASKLIEYLNEHREENKARDNEKPFFAYLPFTAPHWPIQAPRESIEKYKGVYDEGPTVLRQKRLAKQKELGIIPEEIQPHPIVGPERTEWENLEELQRLKSARVMEAYAGMVDRMDWNIGKVIDNLEANGDIDNTIVIFMSDNGAEGAGDEARPLISDSMSKHLEKYYNNTLDNIGNYDSYAWYGPRWAQAATAPSKLFKMFTSEGGIHVPLIIKYPKTPDELKGNIARVFTTVMDIMPTLLEFAGIPLPDTNNFRGRRVEPIRGKSWVPYLTSPNSVERIHSSDDTVGWELFGNGALRKGDWKITFLSKPTGDNKWHLYNIKNDPGEVSDLSEQEPEKFEELLKDWKVYVSTSQVVGLSTELDEVPIDEIEDETLWMKYERNSAYTLLRMVERDEPIVYDYPSNANIHGI